MPSKNRTDEVEKSECVKPTTKNRPCYPVQGREVPCYLWPVYAKMGGDRSIEALLGEYRIRIVVGDSFGGGKSEISALAI